MRLGPNYLMLDPDSDEARKECYSLGVPETLTRYSRNKAFVFASPQGLGNILLTHKGESGAIDILNGYCLVYGTHRTSDRIFLEIPTFKPTAAPTWMLEWIERFRSEAPTPIEFTTDDPPVYLNEGGLEWWHGERVITGANGETDRSATLFQIGLALARGNAGGQVIANALAERDEALCLNKYSGRKDASVRYTEIARRVISVRSQTGRSPIAVAFREAPNA